MNDNNIILKRNSLLQKIDYYIDESIYYRTHSDQFKYTKLVLFKSLEENR